MSETKLLRGNLKEKSTLIEFFKFCDLWTTTEYKNKGKNYLPTTADPKNGRKYKQGFIVAARRQFGVKSQQTIIGRKNGVLVGRLADFPNGITEASKHHAGVQNVTVDQWEKTQCYKAIVENVAGSWDSEKQRLTKQGQKYNTPLYRVWLAAGKQDPLTFDLTTWLTFGWGKQPKNPDSCPPQFRDAETKLIQYAAAIAFRWAMQNSINPDVAHVRQIDDSRFNVDDLKREKGKHKGHYLSEEQTLMFPNSIWRTDTLMLSYYGQLFGGRFEALNNLTPAKIDREAHKLLVYESKISREIEKPIFEPETSFMYRYIVEQKIQYGQPLFGRSITAYNDELKATTEYFKQTPFPLTFDPTTHTAFKHTAVTQMSLHGVRMDTISDYIGTDPNTLKEFYRGGSEENIEVEIGGMAKERKAATWRAYVKKLTEAYEKRFNELKAIPEQTRIAELKKLLQAYATSHPKKKKVRGVAA